MSIHKTAPRVRYEHTNTDTIDLKDQKVRLVNTDNVTIELYEIGTQAKKTPSTDPTRQQRCLQWLKTNLFLILTFVGITIGLLIGLTVRQAQPSDDAVIWIGMPGELYMRLIQAMILPLIFCTVIDGTANTDPRSNGRIGLVTMAYIIITNALGGITGIALCYMIQPGSIRSDAGGVDAPDTKNLQTVDIFADFIRNIFPDNIVAATMQMSQTKYASREITIQNNISGLVMNHTTLQVDKSVGTVSGTNILGLIVISAALGIAASQTKEKTRPFIDFFNAGAIVIFKLFSWVQWTTPIGVASLIARALAKVDNIESAFSSMGMFVLTTSGGCLLYQWIILTLILVIIPRTNPFIFSTHAFKPWMLAFGPATSTIPLPEMLRVSDEVYNIDPRVAGFTLPFCVTLNRDGSCLFIAATCLFITQYTGTDMGTGDIFTLTILAIMSSLAIPSVPSASVVSILIILTSLGISTENIGLVMAVEWLNDRIRTSTNVVSHMVGVLVTWRLCKASLRSKDIADGRLDMVKVTEIQ